MIYQDGKVFMICEVGQAISIEIYLEYCNIRKNDIINQAVQIFSNIYSLASISMLSDILAVLNYV